MSVFATKGRLAAAALVVGVAAAFGGAPTASAQDCGLRQIARHGDAQRTRIYASVDGLPALYYRADMDVNTDGAARSYHPDDPRARRLAVNNMGNALTRIVDARGRDVTCSPRRGACYTRFMRIFEAARDADYRPSGAPRIETRGIIPWKRGPGDAWPKPCQIETGPHAGFFVSQTSVIVDPSRDVCDQARYLDAFAFNANVLPRNVRWASQGVRTDKTDLVVARDRVTGRLAFAINGDVGPARKIGEGSIRLAAAMAGRTLRGDESARVVRGLARREVDYLIFPSRDVRRLTGGRFTQADIDRLGAQAFAEWGGVARLDACARGLRR